MPVVVELSTSNFLRGVVCRVCGTCIKTPATPSEIQCPCVNQSFVAVRKQSGGMEICWGGIHLDRVHPVFKS